MAVPKAKAKKTKKPEPSRYDIIKTTNIMNLAVMIRTMYTVYGWRTKRLSDFIEAYLSLIEEIHDDRNTVLQLVQDTKDLTGIDTTELLDKVMSRKWGL